MVQERVLGLDGSGDIRHGYVVNGIGIYADVLEAR